MSKLNWFLRMLLKVGIKIKLNLGWDVPMINRRIEIRLNNHVLPQNPLVRFFDDKVLIKFDTKALSDDDLGKLEGYGLFDDWVMESGWLVFYRRVNSHSTQKTQSNN